MKPITTFTRLGLLPTLCLIFLLAGCGTHVQSEANCDSGAACAPAGNTSTTNFDPSEPPPTREKTRKGIGPNGPPDSTLVYGRRVVVGLQGSYCWFRGGSGECVDTALAVPKETLRVPGGAELHFAYRGRQATEIRGTSYPIAQNDRVNYPEGARSLKHVENRNKTSIPVDLPPGEYLLEVFVKVPEGDASYYFRLFVRPDETEGDRGPDRSAPQSSQGIVAAPLPGTTTPVPDNGSLCSGVYEVTKHENLVYGGDVVVRCEYLVKMGAPAKPASEDVTFNGSVVEPLTREAVELCAKAGFTPEGASP